MQNPLAEISPRIVVLCGSLRSGTTLLRTLLGEHPQLSDGGESDYLFDYVTAEGVRTGGSAAEREALSRAIDGDRIPRDLGVTPPAPAAIGAMVAQMIEQSMPTQGRLLLTLHRNFDVAAAALPGAFFVHLVRDPRDVALSSMRMGWAGNAYHGVECWREAETSWHEAVNAAASLRSCTLTFEALTSQPEPSLRAVLEEAGLPYDAAVLRPPSNSTYGAPKGDRIEAWRKELSAEEAAEVDWRIADVPDDGHYARHPAKPNARRRAALAVQDVIGRQRFFADRYGVRNWVADQATRRVLGGRTPALQRRLDEMSRPHLK